VARNKATKLGEDQTLEGLRKVVEGWRLGWNRVDMPTHRVVHAVGAGNLKGGTCDPLFVASVTGNGSGGIRKGL
jgi:hypothetical protein